MAGDPNWSSVSLLLHGEALVDSSPTPKTLTAGGNAAVSAAQKKFGGGSLAFDGSGDVISTPMSSAFYLSASGATIEAFVYIAADSAADGSGSRRAGIVGTSNNGSTAEFGLMIDGDAGITGTGLILEWRNAAGTTQYRGANCSISKNAWHHIAACVSPSATVFYLDGVGYSDAALTINVDGPSSGGLWVGRHTNFAPWERYLNGYIDELRITKGVARYTADFTPPTAPHPDGMGQVSGAVASNGAAAVRTVRAYRRDTGAMVANTTSDAAGAYSFYTPTLDELSVICLDDAAGTLENDKILRVIPA